MVKNSVNSHKKGINGMDINYLEQTKKILHILSLLIKAIDPYLALTFFNLEKYFLWQRQITGQNTSSLSHWFLPLADYYLAMIGLS